jgi:hypothetical protein
MGASFSLYKKKERKEEEKDIERTSNPRKRKVEVKEREEGKKEERAGKGILGSVLSEGDRDGAVGRQETQRGTNPIWFSWFSLVTLQGFSFTYDSPQSSSLEHKNKLSEIIPPFLSAFSFLLFLFLLYHFVCHFAKLMPATKKRGEEQLERKVREKASAQSFDLPTTNCG